MRIGSGIDVSELFGKRPIIAKHLLTEMSISSGSVIKVI